MGRQVCLTIPKNKLKFKGFGLAGWAVDKLKKIGFKVEICTPVGMRIIFYKLV